MPCCLCMVLSAQEQNMPGFFYHHHKHRLGREKKGKATQYIVKASGINHIVIQNSGSSCYSLAVAVFIVRSVHSSSYVALSWP